MKRSEFLAGGGALVLSGLAARVGAAVQTPERRSLPASPAEGRLTPPASGDILVAVAISEGVTVIDFCGPWEVFQDASVAVDPNPAFRLVTVSESTRPVTASGGLRVVPAYSFENVPQPRVIVVPAQRGGHALHAWLRKASEKADLTMSVCTGAFQLARAGLLSGKAATTHHDFVDDLAREFPDIQVKRGLRFVESAPHIATAGGLSSGIDLALRVVERYFGRAAAERTAFYMEYQSKGWIV